jgi:hypothetical protein
LFQNSDAPAKEVRPVPVPDHTSPPVLRPGEKAVPSRVLVDLALLDTLLTDSPAESTDRARHITHEAVDQATRTSDNFSTDRLIDTADKYLYQAKENGRNRMEGGLFAKL